MTSKTYLNILQTARRLFVEQGYTATSIRQIAETIGIGKATIYHHFPEKQAIVMALLEQNLGQMNDALAAVRREKEPRRRIEVAAQSSTRFLLESADVMQIARREVPRARDEIQQQFRLFLKDYLALLSEAIQLGSEQGIFRPVDPLQATRVFMIMIQGTFAMAYTSGERFQSPEQAAELLLDVFFRGIDAR
ncbi:MAG: TetR/AcrR family transcriptional regulator [Chloroflexota bacterium]